jgi:hypothetical protein
MQEPEIGASDSTVPALEVGKGSWRRYAAWFLLAVTSWYFIIV